jgi:hypothetical protein
MNETLLIWNTTLNNIVQSESGYTCSFRMWNACLVFDNIRTDHIQGTHCLRGCSMATSVLSQNFRFQITIYLNAN